MLTETEMPPVLAESPQRSGLDRDLVAFDAMWNEAVPVLHAHVNAGGNGRAALVEVVEDSFMRAYEHGVGATLLLHDARPIPFLAVRRALYETVVTLNYLAMHADPEREAQIALAHQPIHEFWQYREYGLLESDIPLLNDAKRRITELPFDADIIETAHQRQRSYRWTGKSFQQLFASRGNPHEYRFIYGRMSAVVHPDQRQIARNSSNLSPAWYEARAAGCRYLIRETRRLMVVALGVPLPSTWLDEPMPEAP